MMAKKKIPIGVSDFKEIIERDYFYIDKSLLIKELLDDGSKVVLLPRPRRFGKTLNMTMLKYFFEKTGADHGILFHDLQVWDDETIREHQGKYPVIYLTFKDVKHNNWGDCISGFKSLISQLYLEHKYLLNTILLEEKEKAYFNEIIWERADSANLEVSVRRLCDYLYRYYGQKVIIIIDEYDTPISSAWIGGYYGELINFVRNLLSGALKDNPSLEKAVITGIMRIAKESIFSGLNNLYVATVLQQQYSDKFGFLDAEAEKLLEYCGIQAKMPDLREWYNGYLFGGNVIYNPWSILNYANKPEEGFRPYWVNTGSNDLIRDILTRSGSQVKQEMEILISGGTLEKQVREDTVLTEIESSPESIWSFLLFSGYLKAVDRTLVEESTVCRLQIPNREVRYVYKEIIMNWTSQGISGNDYRLMLQCLTGGDIKTFGKIFRNIVTKSLSYFDVGGNEPERFYHAFVLGMMVSLSGEYQVKSNRESGYGRYDVMLVPVKSTGRGIIIEFKKVEEDEGETLESACEAALKQIREKAYRKELEASGVTVILEIGISFRGKEVMVKSQ